MHASCLTGKRGQAPQAPPAALPVAPPALPAALPALPAALPALPAALPAAPPATLLLVANNNSAVHRTPHMFDDESNL